tara:strand:+ start:303 stop:653 length:351 start_codon:yes stop_codon:yes gene_type:complete
MMCDISWIMTRMQWSNECSSCDFGCRSRRAMRSEVLPSPAGQQKPPMRVFLPPAEQQQISYSLSTRQPRACSKGSACRLISSSIFRALSASGSFLMWSILWTLWSVVGLRAAAAIP